MNKYLRKTSLIISGITIFSCGVVVCSACTPIIPHNATSESFSCSQNTNLQMKGDSISFKLTNSKTMYNPEISFSQEISAFCSFNIVAYHSYRIEYVEDCVTPQNNITCTIKGESKNYSFTFSAQPYKSYLQYASDYVFPFNGGIDNPTDFGATCWIINKVDDNMADYRYYFATNYHVTSSIPNPPSDNPQKGPKLRFGWDYDVDSEVSLSITNTRNIGRGNLDPGGTIGIWNFTTQRVGDGTDKGVDMGIFYVNFNTEISTNNELKVRLDRINSRGYKDLSGKFHLHHFIDGRQEINQNNKAICVSYPWKWGYINRAIDVWDTVYEYGPHPHEPIGDGYVDTTMNYGFKPHGQNYAAGGSSGSPLFDQQGNVLGILWGATMWYNTPLTIYFSVFYDTANGFNFFTQYM